MLAGWLVVCSTVLEDGGWDCVGALGGLYRKLESGEYVCLCVCITTRIRKCTSILLQVSILKF